MLSSSNSTNRKNKSVNNTYDSTEELQEQSNLFSIKKNYNSSYYHSNSSVDKKNKSRNNICISINKQQEPLNLFTADKNYGSNYNEISGEVDEHVIEISEEHLNSAIGPHYNYDNYEIFENIYPRNFSYYKRMYTKIYELPNSPERDIKVKNFIKEYGDFLLKDYKSIDFYLKDKMRHKSNILKIFDKESEKLARKASNNLHKEKRKKYHEILQKIDKIKAYELTEKINKIVANDISSEEIIKKIGSVNMDIKEINNTVTNGLDPCISKIEFEEIIIQIKKLCNIIDEKYKSTSQHNEIKKFINIINEAKKAFYILEPKEIENYINTISFDYSSLLSPSNYKIFQNGVLANKFYPEYTSYLEILYHISCFLVVQNEDINSILKNTDINKYEEHYLLIEGYKENINLIFSLTRKIEAKYASWLTNFFKKAIGSTAFLFSFISLYRASLSFFNVKDDSNDIIKHITLSGSIILNILIVSIFSDFILNAHLTKRISSTISMIRNILYLNQEKIDNALMKMNKI